MKCLAFVCSVIMETIFYYTDRFVKQKASLYPGTENKMLTNNTQMREGSKKFGKDIYFNDHSTNTKQRYMQKKKWNMIVETQPMLVTFFKDFF